MDVWNSLTWMIEVITRHLSIIQHFLQFSSVFFPSEKPVNGLKCALTVLLFQQLFIKQLFSCDKLDLGVLLRPLH